MSEETKYCPYCGEEILAVAKKCKHCGEWLEEKEETVIEMTHCPACGEDIPANAVVCMHCGEDLNHTTCRSEENKGNAELTIALAYAPVSIGLFANVIVYVDGVKYKINNGDEIHLSVNSGIHHIECESDFVIKRRNSITVNVQNVCVVGMKYNRMTGKLNIKEGLFKKDNTLCFLGFLFSLAGMFIGFVHILGIILSIIGLCKFDEETESGKGYGIAGVAIGIAIAVLGAFIMIGAGLLENL